MKTKCGKWRKKQVAAKILSLRWMDKTDEIIIKGYLGCLSGSSSFRSSGEMS